MRFYPDANMFAKTIRKTLYWPAHGEFTEHLGRMDF